MEIYIKQEDNSLFTNEELSYIEFLKTHELFEKFVIEIRKSLGIPVKIGEEQGTTKLDKRKKEMLGSLALLLTRIYENLPENWHITFASVIMTGYAIKPPDTITFSLEEDPFGNTDQKELRIIVRSKVETSNIIAFLESNKSEIDKSLDLLPKDPSTKMSFLSIIRELAKLKKANSTMRHKDVVKIFENTHTIPIPTTLADYHSYNTYYNRFKKKGKMLLKTNPEKIQILESTLMNIKDRI